MEKIQFLIKCIKNGLQSYVLDFFLLLLNSSLWLVESDSNQIKTLLDINQPLMWGIDLEIYSIADKY